MSLDLWFREDIENALRAAEAASAATVAVLGKTGNPEVVRAYRQGYRAALAVVAQAFGISFCLRHDRELPSSRVQQAGSLGGGR